MCGKVWPSSKKENRLNTWRLGGTDWAAPLLAWQCWYSIFYLCIILSSFHLFIESLDAAPAKQKLDENWIEHFFFPPSFCLFVNLRKFDKIVGSGIVCLIQINLMKEKRRGNPGIIPHWLDQNYSGTQMTEPISSRDNPSILGITLNVYILRKVTMSSKLWAGVNCGIMPDSASPPPE